MKEKGKREGRRGGVAYVLSHGLQQEFLLLWGGSFPLRGLRGKRQRMSFSWQTKNARASRSFLCSCVFYTSLYLYANDMNKGPSFSFSLDLSQRNTDA